MTYEYNAHIVRVTDGDTIVVDVDLGFSTWLHGLNVRLLGVNARELAEPGGPEAAANLAQALTPGTAITLATVKPDKYGGRWLGAVHLGDGADLSATLISTQWAAPWNGRGAKPTPPWPRTITLNP